MEEEKSTFLSKTVFGFTLSLVIISLVGLFFPALITSILFPVTLPIDPFDLGTWVIPFITVNLILLGFAILYYKKILPKVIFRFIKFVLNFEVSPRIATIVIVTLFGIYIGFTVNELFIYEGEEWGDFIRIRIAIEEFPFNVHAENEAIVYVKNFFLWASHNIFDNIRILPFVGSISLLLLTYFFTVQLTKKRFAGIIAVIILMQSSTFLRYDTSATYSYFWTLFYVLSLYVINNKSYLTHIFFIFSLFSKPLIVTFLPMSMFFTYNAKIPKKRKILIILVYAIILGSALVGLMSGKILATPIHGFDYAAFWMAFSVFAAELRFDWIVLVFLLPVVIGLYLTSKKGITQADSILFLILGGLLSQAILAALTGHNILPYRYIPLIVFFAVGVGTLFSKKITLSVCKEYKV